MLIMARRTFVFNHRHALLLCLLLFAASGIGAEVLFTDDGNVIIGTIVKSEGGLSTYRTLGGQIAVESASIMRSEPSIDSLAELPVFVELMDGSMLRGKIVDFDPDIGLFLDISFGVLTIPGASVKSIKEPKQDRLYSGNPFGARLGASWYLPIGGLASQFGPSLRFEATASYMLPKVRGLALGLDLSYSLADFTAREDVDYDFIALEPLVSFHYLDWRTKSSFIRMFSPFAEAGLGPVLVRADDTSGSLDKLGEMSLGAFAKLGCDIDLIKGFGLRAQLRFDAYLQKGAPFMAVSAGILGGF
jgi:hypothetical protein